MFILQIVPSSVDGTKQVGWDKAKVQWVHLVSKIGCRLYTDLLPQQVTVSELLDLKRLPH